MAILHFIRDQENPYGIVSQLVEALPSGSYLVVSHATSDDASAEAANKVSSLYDRASAPAVPRTRPAIQRFFEGLEMVPPGLVDVASWCVDRMATEPGPTILYGGVAWKR